MPNSGLLVEQGQTASPGQSPDLFPFRRLVRRFTPMERIRELYCRAQQPVNRSILENVLSEMRVEYKVTDNDLARIPIKGPTIVTANHPFGLLDGAILGALLSRTRPDVKILTNFLLAGIPELHEHCIFVDPFGKRESAARNLRGIKQAIAWLNDGGMLATFPAGEVSHIRFPHLAIADPQWNSIAARLSRITGAAAVPVYFPGCNSATFQALGLLHPRLRTSRLISEFLQQTDREVEVRIGSPIPAERIRDLGADGQAAVYLRWRTYILAQRGEARRRAHPIVRFWPNRGAQEDISAAVPQPLLLQDVENLAPQQCLYKNREFSVYLAETCQIPNLIQEVGRLREVTFRAVGEGTGRCSDLDRFDQHYKHVFLWSNLNCELVGAYRMGLTSEILPVNGVRGLYTSTLFRYDLRLFDQLGPALELGRSFVRPEYQRQYSPLLMLWKGIGRFLALHPELAVLFGAVSISSRYSRWSRETIVRFFQAQRGNREIARLITPRCPFHPRWTHGEHHLTACAKLDHLEQLADPIADVESDGKGVPILLKQYAKLGGQLVSFNVDRNFSDVLDGLVLVDLRRTNPDVLQRYMGEDGMEAFRRYHGVSNAAEA